MVGNNGHTHTYTQYTHAHTHTVYTHTLARASTLFLASVEVEKAAVSALIVALLRLFLCQNTAFSETRWQIWNFSHLWEQSSVIFLDQVFPHLNSSTSFPRPSQ